MTCFTHTPARRRHERPAAGGTALGEGPVVVLLHAGGPDRWSLLPLARRLRDRFTVLLPDIRGYGTPVCADPSRHTWQQ
ncbi:alpha/beta fold hydrolase [Streptomyces sp. NPDC047108]|uniref:alpha/beta fold hydrolase n=1 Tax=Streptomyces sp. NPDC047108 TaxID=3155025 RepID=UPI0033DD096B